MGVFAIMIAAVVLSVGVVCFLFWIAAWVAKRFGWAKSGIGILIAGVLFFALSGVQTIVACSAEPQWYPPIENSGGDGRMIHACDGPGGLLSYLFSLIIAPLASLILALLAFRQWRQIRGEKLA